MKKRSGHASVWVWFQERAGDKQNGDVQWEIEDWVPVGGTRTREYVRPHEPGEI
jgi:hypothetical protein